MTKLVWGAAGSRQYETGIDQAVFYPASGAAGVVWNGIISLSESPNGGELVPYYIDGFKYLNSPAPSEFSATLTAFGAPDEFAACEGLVSTGTGLIFGYQPRLSFGLAYRTKIGNDQTSDLGYKIHLVYQASVVPSERSYQTISNSANPLNLSWAISIKPLEITGQKPTAKLTLDSTKAVPSKLATVEGWLYGTASTAPRLPTPAEIISALA